MVKENEKTYRLGTALIRLACIMLMLVTMTVMLAPPSFAYAATEKEKDKGTDKEQEKEEPIREVHDVVVGDEMYCFFVTHNVVLTPAEVAEMTDEELTAAIFERAGLYMKKTNCKKASHKEITIKQWNQKKKGDLQLDAAYIEDMRLAEPEDGDPFKFYMDLTITRKTGETVINDEGEEEEEIVEYSTFKRTSPRLLFAVVATEEDAKYGEDICVDDKKPGKKQKTKTKTKKAKTPHVSEPKEPPEEMLPEYRTINLADRSGEPIEETLKDGSPVDLEWVEPKDIVTEEEPTFFDRIPGGKTGLAIMAAVLVAAIAAVIAALKRKRTDE